MPKIKILPRFDPSKAKIFSLMFRMEISEYDHIIQLFKEGVGNKTDHLNYLGHPVPLFGGGFT